MDYLKIYEEEHIKNRLSYSQIREKYNISRGTWDYWIRKKLGKKADLRKHPANDNFFDSIDTENNRLNVLIDLFGQETPVEVELFQVNKIQE